MARFKSRPIEIEATQWHRDGDHPAVRVIPGTDYSEVLSRQGWARVNPGDWIIKEPASDGFYPCAAEVFAERYEPVGKAQDNGDDYSKTDDSARPSDGITQTLPVIPETASDLADHYKVYAEGQQDAQQASERLPRVGDIVQFYSATSMVLDGRLCAAIVTDVVPNSPDQAVNLAVFSPSGGLHPFLSVPLCEKSAGGPMWWGWR